MEENLGTRCQNSARDERRGSSTGQVRGSLGDSERGKAWVLTQVLGGDDDSG